MGAQSPPETRYRVTLVDGGLPEPELQWQVWRKGVLIAVFDLAYPELGIGMNYDGRVHETRLVTDRRQRDLVALEDWACLVATERTLALPRTLVAETLELRRRRQQERGLDLPSGS